MDPRRLTPVILWRVTGGSMAPTLRDGQVVRMVSVAHARRAPRRGEVVFARHPFLRDVTLVKRVAAVRGNRCFLVGDRAEESSDSRIWGWLPLAAVLGIALGVRSRSRSQTIAPRSEESAVQAARRGALRLRPRDEHACGSR